MKGKFTRKDNNVLLTTTRTLVGGELVQVSGSRHADANSFPVFRSCRSKCPHKPSAPLSSSRRLTTTKGWMPRGSSRSSNLDNEVQIVFLYK